MKKYALLLLLFIIHCQAFGQNNIDNENDISALSIQKLQKEYATRFEANPNLYNGPEYIDYTRKYFRKDGNQFFGDNNPQQGSVYYNNQYFSNIKLWYDLVLDQVVILHPSMSFTPRLVNEKVRFFTIDGRRFIRIAADSVERNIIQKGYYQVLTDSTIRILAKRIKLFNERLEQGNTNVEFYSKDKFFLYKKGLYYAIDTKSSVLKHMTDHIDEVHKFIKERNLKFNKINRETSIVILADYYNNLSNI